MVSHWAWVFSQKGRLKKQSLVTDILYLKREKHVLFRPIKNAFILHDFYFLNERQQLNCIKWIGQLAKNSLSILKVTVLLNQAYKIY